MESTMKLMGWPIADDCIRLLKRGATEEYIELRIIAAKGLDKETARDIIRKANAHWEANPGFLSEDQKKLEVLTE